MDREAGCAAVCGVTKRQTRLSDSTELRPSWHPLVVQWWRICTKILCTKNLPKLETQEARVWSLGLGDPPEWEMAIHFSVPAWEIPRTEESGGHNPQGLKESDTTERLSPHACSLFLRTYKWCQLKGKIHINNLDTLATVFNDTKNWEID